MTKKAVEYVRIYGDSAVVAGSETVTWAGKMPTAGQSSHLRFTAVWMKQGGGWQEGCPPCQHHWAAVRVVRVSVAGAKAVLVVTASAFFAFVSISCGSPGPATERRTAPIADDSPIGRAFTSRASNVQVEGEGRVTRVLPDDLNGGRHQRFVVRLASGQTLLVAHNIDIAPRIDGLKEGDSVRFTGEYVWNEEGGVIHWTHHDPEGRHVAGWVKHNGKTFK